MIDSDDEADADTTAEDVNAIPSTAPLEVSTQANETPAKTPTAAISAAFGFAQPQKSPAFGLSQVFAGTMAGSQSQTQTQGRPGHESLDVSPMFARHMMPALSRRSALDF